MVIGRVLVIWGNRMSRRSLAASEVIVLTWLVRRQGAPLVVVPYKRSKAWLQPFCLSSIRSARYRTRVAGTSFHLAIKVRPCNGRASQPSEPGRCHSGGGGLSAAYQMRARPRSGTTQRIPALHGGTPNGASRVILDVVGSRAIATRHIVGATARIRPTHRRSPGRKPSPSPTR